MKKACDLGFSVSCYKGDVPLLRGCLASIRYFAPDAPICLVIDSDFDSRPFVKKYGVSCIRKSDVKNPELRKSCFGYGVTKLVALWESPFDRAIHIDADTVLWGDIRNNLPDGDWDFVHNEAHEEITDHIQKTQYFDPEFINEQLKEFDSRGNPYFNTGVFAFKRGSLNLNDCIRLLEIRSENIDKFGAGDQGVLNILVFKAMKEKCLNVTGAHLQSVVPVLSQAELEARFRIENGKPVAWLKPSVVHWAGPKPYTTNADVFSLPMDYFRELGMTDTEFFRSLSVRQAMQADEFISREFPKIKLKAKKFLKKLFRLAS